MFGIRLISLIRGWRWHFKVDKVVAKPINMRYLVDIFVKKVNSNFNYAKLSLRQVSFHFYSSHPVRTVRLALMTRPEAPKDVLNQNI